MWVLVDVMLTVLKLVVAAMLTSLVVFIVCWLCSLDWWIAVVVAIMTIVTGIIVNKVTDGRF